MKEIKYKKAVVFCNGDLADLSRVRKHIDKKTLLIGCDGGTAHILSLGLTPHVVIGDFDSISAKTIRALSSGGGSASRGEGRQIEYIQYPTDKLYTDSELGLTLAVERGCKEIILAGVRGTATDHLLGNIFMLAKKKFAAFKIMIVEGREEMMVVRKHIRIAGSKGDDLSLIAIGADASGVSTKGLFYPLKNAVLTSGTAQGIRNKMTATHAEITLKKGTLLVIHRLTRT
jgi:thiamine pyrophosphokinase